MFKGGVEVGFLNSQVYSEFVFDPVRWPQAEMYKDFSNLSELFQAKKSVVRVPDLDPKYKVAVFASKQLVPTSDSAAKFAESFRVIHEEVQRHLTDVYAGVKDRVDRHRPYRIIQRIGDNAYELDIPGACSKVVNAKLRTQFYGDIPSHLVTPSSDIELTDEIDEILDSRLDTAGHVEFLIRWDHCLVDLLHGWQDGRLPVDITCVISNHERAPNTHVFRFLERHGIPYHYLSTKDGNKREVEILDLVKNTDFLVLARYMQILSGKFLEGYGKDIINIHHGLLPSFKGGYPSKQAFDAGVKLIGATSHFVTEELDAGPIIEQMVERVSHRDTLQSFIHKSETLEKQCLAKAIKSYCELRVLPYEEIKTVVF
ncbi:hypothetical protein GIB67_001169 [Kingdonia uniflora]|uniref:Formyl transferase N-terminal domain-containing protein n=1 Tax=Kingdonia uniflora TaxID=39325 RepID=A0A7J7LG47_9MAGN|nr:hypothetical protein GIB67_001169 [Kingdonia uniflora]